MKERIRGDIKVLWIEGFLRLGYSKDFGRLVFLVLGIWRRDGDLGK